MPVTFDFNAANTTSASKLGNDGGDGILNWVEGNVSFALSPSAGSGLWFLNGEPTDTQVEISNTSFNGKFTLNFSDTGGNKLLGGVVNLDVVGSGGFTWLTTDGVGGAGTAAGVDGADLALAAGQYVSGIRFSVSAGNKMQIDTLTSSLSSLVCFLEGTRIATIDGEKPVEALVAGDRLRRSDGGETTVKWVGRQSRDPRLCHPAHVNPICVRAGALGPNVPARDLFVTAEHALELDGVLYNAGALVNGRSIFRLARVPLDKRLDYFHVETDSHELIVAEGAAAESYLDVPSRDSFDNAHEAPSQEAIHEMPLPRVATARMVPENVAAYLVRRAEEISRRVA